MNEGDRLKKQGLDKVEANNSAFVEALRHQAIKLIEKNGQVSIDELRAYADRKGLKPNHSNAFGSIFRTKNFKAVGFKKSQLPSNHSRRIIIWELV